METGGQVEFVDGNHNFRLPPVPLFAQIHLTSARGQVGFVSEDHNFCLPPVPISAQIHLTRSGLDNKRLGSGGIC